MQIHSKSKYCFPHTMCMGCWLFAPRIKVTKSSCQATSVHPQSAAEFGFVGPCHALRKLVHYTTRRSDEDTLAWCAFEMEAALAYISVNTGKLGQPKANLPPLEPLLRTCHCIDSLHGRPLRNPAPRYHCVGSVVPIVFRDRRALAAVCSATPVC